LAANGQPGASGAAGGGGKRESIINYEVDKTVRVVKGATGVVKRINAAVVVNNQVTTDDKGKVSSIPLTEVQIEKMTALVRETVGFNKERGDSVNLLNAPFAMAKNEMVDLPLWKQPEVLDTARSFAWPLGTLLLAGLVFLGVVRPAMKTLLQSGGRVPRADAGRENQLDALEADTPERPQLTRSTEAAAPTEGELRLEDARQLTRDNPAAVANIVKAWMSGETPTGSTT
jgi:flagellar M-ring protein FliF